MYKKFLTTVLFVCTSLSLIPTPKSFAWGPQGHNLIARTAVRLLIEKTNHNPKITVPFQQKEMMLGFLSNIPDRLWRSLPKEQTQLGNPTHYFDIDLISATPSFNTVPANLKQIFSLVKKRCTPRDQEYPCLGKDFQKTSLATAVGSAPWRVEQFWKKIKNSFEQAGKSSKNKKKQNSAINTAMLNAGLMSHFSGDLSNPMHNSTDYDGWNSKQGGLHGYFEDMIINEYQPQLAQDVFAFALKHKPAQKKLNSLITAYKTQDKPSKKHSQRLTDPLYLSLALSISAFKRLDELLNLDKKYSMINQSIGQKKGSKKTKAKRKDPKAIKKEFYQFSIEQLAIAADLTSQLWINAWLAAGSPDLSRYHSYKFHFKPQFVPPDYLP